MQRTQRSTLIPTPLPDALSRTLPAGTRIDHAMQTNVDRELEHTVTITLPNGQQATASNAHYLEARDLAARALLGNGPPRWAGPVMPEQGLDEAHARITCLEDIILDYVTRQGLTVYRGSQLAIEARSIKQARARTLDH